MFSVEFDANIALSIWWFQAVTSLQTAMLAYSGTFLLPTSWGMPNIGRTETEAMLAGVGRNHPNDHFLQIPRVDNVARCYVCELVPGLKKSYVRFRRCIPYYPHSLANPLGAYITFRQTPSISHIHWVDKPLNTHMNNCIS